MSFVVVNTNPYFTNQLCHHILNSMMKPPYLREILAQNVKSARNSLHITQENLAEYASIAYPTMRDIENCRTWVSDKTLDNIAKALNMEAYELLIPPKIKEGRESEQSQTTLQKTAKLINTKKRELNKRTSEIMDDLVHEIIKIHS